MPAETILLVMLTPAAAVCCTPSYLCDTPSFSRYAAGRRHECGAAAARHVRRWRGRDHAGPPGSARQRQKCATTPHTPHPAAVQLRKHTCEASPGGPVPAALPLHADGRATCRTCQAMTHGGQPLAFCTCSSASAVQHPASSQQHLCPLAADCLMHVTSVQPLVPAQTTSAPSQPASS